MTRHRITSLEVLCGLLLLAMALHGQLTRLFDVPALRTGATVFVAICVQALPFLVLGTLISAAIATVTPAATLLRVGLAGLALPGCDCTAVPVTSRLIRSGLPTPAAVAFLLAAPALNPVVLVTTAIAFPHTPMMVLARATASLLTAATVALLWTRFGHRPNQAHHPTDTPRWRTFLTTARTDLTDSAGYLVIGALAAAVLNIAIPPHWTATLGGQPVLGVLMLALLAVILAVCSTADAFVAASMSTLPLLPRLVFLVVGPVVDVKQIALQLGTFGRSFVTRFAPTVFAVATCSAVAVGTLLLDGTR